MQLFEGDGQGPDAQPGVSVGSAQMFTTQLAVLDANLDSKPDLAVVAGAAVTLLYGDGRGVFRRGVPSIPPPLAAMSARSPWPTTMAMVGRTWRSPTP